MKTKFILALAFCFFIAAATAEAGLLVDNTRILIKPEKNFTVGDSAYLYLDVLSKPGTINFSVNITGISGLTTLADFNTVGRTDDCDIFGVICSNESTWLFTINSLPVTFQAIITNIDTGISITKNVTTGIDADNDSYYSVASGGNDCDDNNAGVHPGATEVCENGLDDDCSGGDDSCGGSGNNGGSSSGGSNGGGPGGSVISMTYNCLDGAVKVAPNDKIQFIYKGTNYTFFVKDIMSSTAVFKLYPIPSRDIQLKEGTAKYIDLDWNNFNDLKMTISDAEPNTQVKVSCDLIKESEKEVQEEKKDIPILSNIKEGVLSIASEIVPKDRASPIVGSVLALAIIVIGLLGYSLYSRSRKDDDDLKL